MAMSKQYAAYDTIGTASTAATLTAAYTGNTKTLFCGGFPQIHLDFKYTPKSGQTNRYVSLLVEVSNDDGTTFFPFATVSTSTVDNSVYVSGTDPGAGAGVGQTVPGDKITTGGTAYSGYIDIQTVGDHVKISAKESGTANFGTLYVRTALQD